MFYFRSSESDVTRELTPAHLKLITPVMDLHFIRCKVVFGDILQGIMSYKQQNIFTFTPGNGGKHVFVALLKN